MIFNNLNKKIKKIQQHHHFYPFEIFDSNFDNIINVDIIVFYFKKKKIKTETLQSEIYIYKLTSLYFFIFISLILKIVNVLPFLI